MGDNVSFLLILKENNTYLCLGYFTAISFSSQLLTSKKCTQCTKEAIDWRSAPVHRLNHCSLFKHLSMPLFIFWTLIRDKISIAFSSDKSISSEILHLTHSFKMHFMRVYPPSHGCVQVESLSCGVNYNSS